MRNIFLFIRRYFNLLVFLLFQALSIYLIVSYSKFHHAMFGHSANIVTGGVNKKYNNIQSYFQLKSSNDSLLKANEYLYNQLQAGSNDPDSIINKTLYPVKGDSTSTPRGFQYLGAKVVANSTAAQNNYVVLYGNNVSEFNTPMAVVDPNNNVVGSIREVSGNYAVVMSLLHKDSRLSAKLLKTGETGTMTWEGNQPNIFSLAGIPKDVKLTKGDSVITSGFSTTFPKGLLLGRIESVQKDPSSNSLKVSVRSACNFYNLQYAYAIFNPQKATIDKLLEKNKVKSD